MDFLPVGCSRRGFTQLLSTLQGKFIHANGHRASLEIGLQGKRWELIAVIKVHGPVPL